MLEAAGVALSHIASWQVLLALGAGTIIGVLSGALPGGAVPTLVVLLGFAYGMDPFIALPLAIGMVSTVPTGDTLPAVLLGIPGSTSGQATILDGNPMARQGRAGVALSAAYFASLIGGVVGAIFLLITIPVARPVVNSFGAAEFFILGLVAIMVVGVVSSGALLRGLMVGAIGLLISTVGFDAGSGIARSTFGVDYLWSGIHIVPVVIGLFALPEFIDMIISDQPIARSAGSDLMKQANSGRREGMNEVLHNWPLVFRSAGLGVFVGLLPGIGGSLAQWLAYASARQTVSGGTKTFGTGDVRGVIAPESANNAVDGGSLVPTLFFGVPGSVGMAIFLGFLVILGLQPGPSMLDEHLDLTMTIVFALVLANVFATSLALAFTPWLAKIAFVRPNVLVPLAFATLSLAAFQANFQIADLLVMLAFGFVGFFMKTYGWPRPPIIIAVVLGPIVDKFYSIASQTYGWEMFTRIPVIAILSLAIVTGAYTVWVQRKVTSQTPLPDGEGDIADLVAVAAAPEPAAPHRSLKAKLRPTANGVFVAFAGVAFIYFLAISQWCGSLDFCHGKDWPLTAARLPFLASIAGIIVVTLYALVHLIQAPSTGERKIMDIGRTKTGDDRSTVLRRTLKALGSTVGFVFSIWLVGFQITVPIYIFLYLWIFGQTRWWQALIGSLLFVFILYFFFDNVIHVTWSDPIFGGIIPDILKGK
ncbi:MAG: tripartite tricarboxylate transporter permease [Chloroflexi bacterium]|nr:tripartite tricarboxylate transporter permease [Chloroflexota bacterium]